MDAVVFMDAVKRPARGAAPPPAGARTASRMTANASLIAGVATLVLAIGVGVMIGRSGDSSTPTAAAAPQIIKVGGSGGGEETATASSTGSGSEIGGKGGKAKAAKAPPEKAIDSSGTSEAAAEILKPAGDVKLPPPTVKPAASAKAAPPAATSGKFTGEFFGE